MTGSPASSARGVRKFAVSLFADLTGYTALCERLDPEDVERAVAPLMASMRSAISDERGVVMNVAGDGLFALFGAPDALPDSPTRAVRAADRIRATVADTAASTPELALPDVHIGVAAGEVLLTSAGPGEPSTVIGSSVNLSSRLCDAAVSGEVLVDETCYRLTQQSFSWHERRHLSLKGQDGETTAWPLAGPSAIESPRTGPLGLVGRAQELAALNEALARVQRQSSGSSVLVRGVAGIGKSALVDHWVADHPSLAVWRIACADGWHRDALTTLDRRLGLLVEDSPRSSTVEIIPADRSDPYLELVHRRRATLLGLVADEPHVLLVEDFQAADPTLTDFLTDLIDRPVAGPLLVVCTWRDEPYSADAKEHVPFAESITLGPLENQAAASLISRALSTPLDPAIVDALSARAEGHPLMLREICFAIAARQTDQSTAAGSPRSIQPISESLPTTIQLFLAARLDRLQGGLRAVAHDLSSLGSEFTTDRVERVLGRRSVEALPSLLDAGILATREDRWYFTHGLLREVAYNTLTRAHRADLHSRQLRLLPESADRHERADHAIAWNEAVSPVDREQYAASTVAAVRESLALSRQLYRRQARAAYQAARRVAGAARDCIALDPASTAELWAIEAQCLAELGMYDDSLSLSIQAERVASDAGEERLKLGPLMTRGLVLSRMRRFESARQALDTAAAVAEELSDPVAQAHAIRLAADTWRHSVTSRYVSLTEEAFRLFESAGDRAGAGECARTLAYLSSDAALARFARWRAIAEELTDPDDLRAVAALAKGDAITCGLRFNFEGYRVAGQTLVDAGTALEAPDLLSEGLLNLADVYLHLGDPRAAVETSDALIALATERADPRMRTAAAAAAARPYLRAGQLARSLEELRVAKELATEFGASEKHFVAAEEAMCLADRGYWQEALVVLGASMDTSSAAGLDLATLGKRVEERRISVMVRPDDPRDSLELIAEAEAADAPLMASFLRALDAWADPIAPRSRALPPAQANATLHEIALRGDTAALQLEHSRLSAIAAWEVARAGWAQLGCTIWLARTQARCGDIAAANSTLDLLDSPAEARTWALSGPLEPD